MKGTGIMMPKGIKKRIAGALKLNTKRKDGYLESENTIVTWCVGHLVTMSYPEVYDMKYKKWNMNTLPFIPDTYLYEVIPGTKKQFEIVLKNLSLQIDTDCLYLNIGEGIKLSISKDTIKKVAVSVIKVLSNKQSDDTPSER